MGDRGPPVFLFFLTTEFDLCHARMKPDVTSFKFLKREGERIEEVQEAKRWEISNSDSQNLNSDIPRKTGFAQAKRPRFTKRPFCLLPQNANRS
jgi:hypothetical protein